MLQKLIREPLLQFLFLGGLIFMLNAWLQPQTHEETQLYRIEVTTQQLDALRAAFAAEHGRPATTEELQSRLQLWLDEQMLYRQALALGLDARDSIVRRQMVQKMRFLLADSQAVPDPTTAELRAFLEAYPQRYGQSRRISFDQVYLSRSAQGSNMAAAVAALQSRLEQKPDDFISLGDPFPAGQQLTAVDDSSLRRDFGQSFAEQLPSLPDGQWTGPITSGLGLHWVRITARHDFVAGSLDDVRQRLVQDWTIHQREMANAEAMQGLRQRFEVIYQLPAEAGAS
ncbi:MAG: peptidyl-prolyl cis-trans isomerase [Nevskiales bacterium]